MRRTPLEHEQALVRQAAGTARFRRRSEWRPLDRDAALVPVVGSDRPGVLGPPATLVPRALVSGRR